MIKNNSCKGLRSTRLINSEDIKAYVNVKGLGPGTYDLPVKIETNDSTIQCIPLKNTVKIRIEKAKDN